MNAKETTTVVKKFTVQMKWMLPIIGNCTAFNNNVYSGDCRPALPNAFAVTEDNNFPDEDTQSKWDFEWLVLYSNLRNRSSTEVWYLNNVLGSTRMNNVLGRTRMGKLWKILQLVFPFGLFYIVISGPFIVYISSSFILTVDLLKNDENETATFNTTAGGDSFPRGYH